MSRRTVAASTPNTMSFNPASEATPEFTSEIPSVLPHEKIYQIQVGYKLFKLSGASLSSDCPSYFTTFFLDPNNKNRTLFIDRSPAVFEKIYTHLQGYDIDIEDDYTYIHLWADAHYYGLKRLANNIVSDFLYARIGNQPFRIPRSLLSTPGNMPNYFTMNYSTLFTDNKRVIEAHKLIRPPPHRPATVAHRSPQLFGDLLEILRGNILVIKDDVHRGLLIKECRYYRFQELEQRIIKHKIISNPFNPSIQELIINISDITPNGLSIPPPFAGGEVHVQYQRPFLPKEPKRDLIFQLDSRHVDSTGVLHSCGEVKLIVNRSVQLMMVKFCGQTCSTFLKNFKRFIDDSDLLVNEIDSPTPAIALFCTLTHCNTIINGIEMKSSWLQDIFGVEPDAAYPTNFKGGDETAETEEEPPAKKRRADSQVKGDIVEFKLVKSQWKLSFFKGHPKLIGIAIDGLTDKTSFIKKNIEFL